MLRRRFFCEHQCFSGVNAQVHLLDCLVFSFYKKASALSRVSERVLVLGDV